MSSTANNLKEMIAPKEESVDILKAAPFRENSAVTANPHIPSVSAAAVLGESETMPEVCTFETLLSLS